MFSIFKRKPADFVGIATANSEAFAIIVSQIQRNLPRVDESYRESWLKVTIKSLAENLKWRAKHEYSGQMDHALGELYRREAARLLKRADHEDRKAGGKGGDGFSKYVAYSLAVCYLLAESLCFEHPNMIDIIQQELLGQKEILRNVNSMLQEYDLQHVGCKLGS